MSLPKKAKDTSIQKAESLKICPHQQNDSTMCRDRALLRAAKKSALSFLAKYDKVLDGATQLGAIAECEGKSMNL